MHLAKLVRYFDSSPALRLLRSPNAPYIVDFLFQQFKRANVITIPHGELLASFASYREQLHESDGDALRDRPEHYLATWCSNDARWLHRFLEAGRSEPVYQLTPHTEDVFHFLERVLDQELGFVGTESRLQLVIQALTDVVVGSAENPDTRLDHLARERQRIDDEMERIRRHGKTTRYQPAQIRERFTTAVSLLKQVQGDFRAVEEKFKEITRQVQQQHLEGMQPRGEILRFALDAEDILKREDQGVSFYEFVRLILSPAHQEKLQAITAQLNQVGELAEQTEGLDAIQQMIPSLLAEAEKVMKTNQRLSATLRRLLDTQAARERQRVAQLLREIRGLAMTLADDPAREACGLEIETGIELRSPFAKTFWSEPARLETVDLSEHLADEDQRWEAFRLLAQMHRLDWRLMNQRIRDAVARRGSMTLKGLLAEYPPDAGVVEVLGYLQIARDDGHVIRRDVSEEIVLPASHPSRNHLAVTVPMVTFLMKQEE